MEVNLNIYINKKKNQTTLKKKKKKTLQNQYLYDFNFMTRFISDLATFPKLS
jgi:hypothetical protein